MSRSDSHSLEAHFARNRSLRVKAELELTRTLEAAPDAEHIENLSGALQIVSPATLVGFLRTGIDARALLGKQLSDRGLDQSGRWVGFAAADLAWRAAFPAAVMVLL